MHGRMLRCFAAAALLVVSPPLALSAIAPVSQDRSILAEAEFTSSEYSDFDTHNDQANDFGAFNSSVSASVRVFDPNSGPEISGSAYQNSQILGGSIFGEGGASAQSEFGTGNGTSHGASSMMVEFSLASAATYDLSGSLDATSQSTGSAEASFELIGPGGTVYSLSTTSGSQPLSSSGALLAGSYTLTVSSTSDIAFAEDTASSSYNFLLTIVPEPAMGSLALVGLLWMRARRSPASLGD